MPGKKKDAARVAREHWVDDDAIIKFFQKMVSRTPKEVRDILDDPAFNAGFVTALVYAKSRAPGGDSNISPGEAAFLGRIIELVLEKTRDTPFVSAN